MGIFSRDSKPNEDSYVESVHASGRKYSANKHITQQMKDLKSSPGGKTTKRR